MNSEPRTRFETSLLSPHKQLTDHSINERFGSPLSSNSRVVSQPDQSTQAQSREGFDLLSRQCDTADHSGGPPQSLSRHFKTSRTITASSNLEANVPKDGVPQERFSTVEQNKVRSIKFERMKKAQERIPVNANKHIMNTEPPEQPAGNQQLMQFVANHDLAASDQGSADKTKVNKKLRRYVRATDNKSMILNYQNEPAQSHHVLSPK